MSSQRKITGRVWGHIMGGEYQSNGLFALIVLNPNFFKLGCFFKNVQLLLIFGPLISNLGLKIIRNFFYFEYFNLNLHYLVFTNELDNISLKLVY